MTKSAVVHSDFPLPHSDFPPAIRVIRVIRGQSSVVFLVSGFRNPSPLCALCGLGVRIR